RVEGHTDSRGSRSLNQGLSDSRANAVRDYLVNAGVSADRLQAQGFGEANPIASNQTPEGRAQNRRIELTVVE
ncbi:MAG: OmpA family protein, partial [Pseudomonadota bacterium]